MKSRTSCAAKVAERRVKRNRQFFFFCVCIFFSLFALCGVLNLYGLENLKRKRQTKKKKNCADSRCKMETLLYVE